MRTLYHGIVMTVLVLSATASATEPDSRSSPFDDNPACMDRASDASTGRCIVPDEGKPRHVYPRRLPASVKGAAAPGTATPKATTTALAPRKATSGK